jgi:tetratricopeptide (TPR) repeat protein
MREALLEAWGTCGSEPTDHDTAELLGCVSQEPSADPSTRALLAAVLLWCGERQRGVALLRGHPWSECDPADAGKAGAALLRLGLVEPALAPLQRALADSDSRNASAYRINLGRALTLAGRAEEALPHLQQGCSLLGQEHSLARRSLAEAYLALGRTDEALACLPAESEQPELVCARAAVLAASCRHEEAAALLREAIERKTETQPLVLMAAELAEVRGRTAEAIALLRQALDSDPNNVVLWARLAQSGQLGGGGPAARDAADKALELAEGKEPPLRAAAQCALAHVLGQASALEEAEAAWREALALQPGCVPALSGLGHLLMQTGRVEEAVACFQQVRAAEPLHGWSQLIQAREVPEDAAVLEAMERAARQPGLEGPLRTGLLFSAAAAWDRKRHHDRAMALAREANEASKALLPYRPEERRARIEQEMAFFSEAFLASRRGWGHASALPVFVLGMPRSGTTLVEQILGSHSQVHGAGELGQIGELIHRLIGWELRLGSGVGYPGLVADLSRNDLHRQAEHMLQALRALAPEGSVHVIDKLPHNFEHIGLIKLLFPNATIVHVRREPRDIAVSNYITDYAAKFGGMGFAYDLGWIGEQLVDHDRLMAHWHRLFPGQILEVPYEELVEDTEGWARRMLVHLGVAWEPQVLAFQELDRPVKTASVWQVRQPVYTTSRARWRRYEAHLGPLEEALAGIPPDPQPLPLPPQPPGLFDAGMAALQAGRAAEAQQLFAQLLQHRPHHAAAQHFLGAALAQQGQVAEAREAMRRSLKLHPFQPSWLGNLAAMEEALGDGAAAEQLREQQRRLLAGKPPQLA